MTIEEIITEYKTYIEEIINRYPIPPGGTIADFGRSVDVVAAFMSDYEENSIKEARRVIENADPEDRKELAVSINEMKLNAFRAHIPAWARQIVDNNPAKNS